MDIGSLLVCSTLFVLLQYLIFLSPISLGQFANNILVGLYLEQQVAFFKNTTSNYVFLRLGDTGPVQIITKAEYLAIAGPKNFN
jgi:hypothetical protein